MYKEEIKKIISMYESVKDFTYTSPTEEMIHNAQKELGINLPADFLWFLSTYGAGGIQFDIFGVVGNQLEFVEETKRYRTFGMPDSLLVIQNCDEWVDCIDTNNGTIVKWDQMFGTSNVLYNSFFEYFLDELRSSIENLE